MAISVEAIETGVLNFAGYDNLGDDRIVVLDIACCDAAFCEVASIADGYGLTWQRRSQFTNVEGGGVTQTVERWWAFAPLQMVNVPINITFSFPPTSKTFACFSVVGCADFGDPWDTNAAIPLSAGNIGGASVPTISGIAWDTDDALVLVQQVTRDQFATQVDPTGYSSIGGQVSNEPAVGGNRTRSLSSYKVFATTGSGVSATGTGGAETPWIMVADVLSGNAPPPPPVRSFAVVIN